MALAFGPAMGLAAPALVPATDTLLVPATDAITGFAVRQWTLPAAEITAGNILKGMGGGCALGVSYYTATHLEDGTVAGEGVACGAGAVAGTVKLGLNVAAGLPNYLVPLTGSNLLTWSAGRVVGQGTVGTLNRNGYTSSGQSQWTSPILPQVQSIIDDGN
jgi:hypothetical protein